MELIGVAFEWFSWAFLVVFSILSSLYIWDCLKHGWRGGG